MNIGSKWDYVGMTQLEIENKFDSYYVYHHIYIPTNEVLYVGKGCRRRCLSFNRREYYEDYKKGLIEVDIVYRTNDEKQALEYEEMEVFYFKYIGMAKYNSDEFHEGKRRGNSMKEMATDTEVQEIDSLDYYSYCNEFDIHDIKFENVKLHKMELNTIRDLEYRNNVDSFMSNLSNKSYDEVKSMYTFAQQNSKDEDIDLRNAYHFIRKYLKKYFK